MKKILTMGIMLLFIGMTISSSTGFNLDKQLTVVPLEGNTLYVGGNGTGNYSKIQDAINDSENGDTVFVYHDSSPYYENLNVNTSINLIGESRNTTVINGSGGEIVVNISADGVIVSGFTIVNYEIINTTTYLFNIQSDYNVISDNILTGNTSYGIYFSYDFDYGYDYNNISDNIIIGNIGTAIFGEYCNYTTIRYNNISTIGGFAISLFVTDNTNIIGNTITGCDLGIELVMTKNTHIYGNIIANNTYGGINSMFGSNNITIVLNTISYHDMGIFIMNVYNGEIIKNNFIGNNYNAYFNHFIGLIFLDISMLGFQSFIPKIHWDGNYWDEPGLQRYIIPGSISIFNYFIRIWNIIGIEKLPINWIYIDRNPAQVPYDII